jgi:hypothetical protein
MTTHTITVNNKQLVQLQDAIDVAIYDAQFDGDDYLAEALRTLSIEVDKAWTDTQEAET